MTSRELAAQRADEQTFIDQIVDDLGDLERREVYADWLEEAGDGRADFVRALTTAIEAGEAPPEVGEHPPVWAAMLGHGLAAGLASRELAMWADLWPLARPMVTLATERVDDDALAVGQSKFGGEPDLPPDVVWPTWTEKPETPLGFVGQLACADLVGTQAARALGLPASGLLSFYCYQDWVEGHQPGMDGEQFERGDTQVLYFPDGELARRPRPGVGEDDEQPNGPFPACRLTLRESWDLPSSRDLVPPELAPLTRVWQELKEPLWALSSIREEVRPGFSHHLGGYSIHFRTSEDPTPTEGQWTTLLTLDSEHDWSWCDGEHLAIWVATDALRAGRFDRVFGYAS